MCGISTVCEQFGLTPRAVRFYEDRGLISSGRDRLNCRRYDSKARARLEQIAAFRQAGLTIEDIQEIFALEDDGPSAKRDLAARKLRARVVELDRARRQAERLLQQYGPELVASAAHHERGEVRRVAAG